MRRHLRGPVPDGGEKKGRGHHPVAGGRAAGWPASSSRLGNGEEGRRKEEVATRVYCEERKRGWEEEWVGYS